MRGPAAAKADQSIARCAGMIPNTTREDGIQIPFSSITLGDTGREFAALSLKVEKD
jgi:hypothetical protein